MTPAALAAVAAHMRSDRKTGSPRLLGVSLFPSKPRHGVVKTSPTNPPRLAVLYLDPGHRVGRGGEGRGSCDGRDDGRDSDPPLTLPLFEPFPRSLRGTGERGGIGRERRCGEGSAEKLSIARPSQRVSQCRTLGFDRAFPTLGAHLLMSFSFPVVESTPVMTLER